MKPRVIWTAQVASLQSRNNVLVDNGRLYVSTSGSTWNAPDDKDGVYCLDAENGQPLWFAPTEADVNEVAIIDGVLIAPCDSSFIYGIEPLSGRTLWRRKLEHRVLAQPLRNGANEALVITDAGEVLTLNTAYGAPRMLTHLHQGVRANPVTITNDPHWPVLVATEAGMVLKFDRIRQSSFRLSFADYAPYSARGEEKHIGVIHSAPAIQGNSVVFGFARDTYYESAALTCISAVDGKIMWSEPKVDEMHFGNCRTTPLIIGNRVVCAFTYSAGLDIFDLSTGSHLGQIVLGQGVFQQWSSPVRVSDSVVAIGRVDGVVSLVDAQAMKLLASVSVSTASAEQPKSNPRAPKRGISDFFDLLPGEPPVGGICMTPTIHAGSIYVGDTSGRLTRVDLNLS